MRKQDLGLLGVVVLGCVACGGGGSAPNVPGNYAGTYVGELVDNTGRTGTVVFHVQGGNPEAVTGQVTYSTGSLGFTGKVVKGGGGTMVFGAPFWSFFALGPSGAKTTTVVISQVIQTINLPNGGSTSHSPASVVPVSGKVALVANPSGIFGNGNNFQGEFTGTITDTALNQATALAVNIDSDGNVLGTAVIQKNGSPTLSGISGTILSSGQLVYTTQGNQISGQGTLTLKAGAPSGTVKLSNGDSATVSLNQVKPIPPPTLRR